MLFDLRGRGRRRIIKVVYITLAFLMGGGLVLFGIGGDVSGGLVDAITERGGGGDSGEKRLVQKETAALAKTRANPKDVVGWAELVRARVQLASTGDRYNPETDAFTADGKTKLRAAAQAWESLLALDPGKNDEVARVASLMVRSYVSLDDLTKAARAQEIIAESREAAGPYSQLAILSYQAGQTRKGDLAAAKALELTDKDMREALKGQLESAKQQAIVNQVTPPASG